LEDLRRIGFQDWLNMCALWHALLIARPPRAEWDGGGLGSALPEGRLCSSAALPA